MERRKKAGLPNLEVLDFGANFWDETCRGSILLFGNPFWIQWHYWFFILGSLQSDVIANFPKSYWRERARKGKREERKRTRREKENERERERRREERGEKEKESEATKKWRQNFETIFFSEKKRKVFGDFDCTFFCLSPKGNLVAKAPHLFLYLSLFLGLSLYLMHIHTHAHTLTRTHAHTHARSHARTLTRSHAHTLTRSHARTHSLALNPHCPSRIELQFVEKNGRKCLKYFSFGIRRMNGRQKGIGLIGPVRWSIL